jgi:hypothetical protein
MGCQQQLTASGAHRRLCVAPRLRKLRHNITATPVLLAGFKGLRNPGMQSNVFGIVL